MQFGDVDGMKRASFTLFSLSGEFGSIEHHQ